MPDPNPMFKTLNAHATRLADEQQRQNISTSYTEAFNHFIKAVNEIWLQDPELEDPCSSKLGAAYRDFWRADEVEEIRIRGKEMRRECGI